MATDMTVSNTILAQLGGRRFIAMTGASSFTGSADALSFRLPSRSTRNKIRGVRITLTPMDTYTVDFLRMAGSFETSDVRVETVETCKDIYADSLRDCFTRVTGLETSLGRVA